MWKSEKTSGFGVRGPESESQALPLWPYAISHFTRLDEGIGLDDLGNHFQL